MLLGKEQTPTSSDSLDSLDPPLAAPSKELLLCTSGQPASSQQSGGGSSAAAAAAAQQQPGGRSTGTCTCSRNPTSLSLSLC